VITWGLKPHAIEAPAIQAFQTQEKEPNALQKALEQVNNSINKRNERRAGFFTALDFF